MTTVWCTGNLRSSLVTSVSADDGLDGAFLTTAPITGDWSKKAKSEEKNLIDWQLDSDGNGKLWIDMWVEITGWKNNNSIFASIILRCGELREECKRWLLPTCGLFEFELSVPIWLSNCRLNKHGLLWTHQTPTSFNDTCILPLIKTERVRGTSNVKNNAQTGNQEEQEVIWRWNSTHHNSISQLEL